MHCRSLASLFRWITSLVAAIFLLAHPIVATAQSAATVQAATPEQVSQFLANPSSILTANQSTADLATTIQGLALANSDANATLAALIALAQSLNAQASNPSNTADQTAAIQAQMAAIGTGLANAATSVQASNPALAAQIQSAVASSGVPTTVASYTAATGDTVISSTGGGAGGVGGPINNSTPTGGGGGSGGGTSASNGSGSSGGSGLTGGGGGGSGSSGSSTTGASVSPH